jgi:hypothetical protein
MVVAMKTSTLIMNLALLVSTPLTADEFKLNYQLSGSLQLTMEQDIYPGEFKEPLAGRNFQMNFSLEEVGSNDNLEQSNLQVRLNEISGSYVAHGMKQRLQTSHLKGEELTFIGDGHGFSSGQSESQIDLGQITDGGLNPFDILLSLLPELPETPVAVGTSWNTERPISTLEGWAWAEGLLQNQHRVETIDQSGSSTIIGIKTSGKTMLKAGQKRAGFIGEGFLERTISWRFDVSNGQLLSLSIEQEGSGVNLLPQGEVPVRQITRYELKGTDKLKVRPE